MAKQHGTDFEGLLALARDKSVDGRTLLVKVVGDLFFGSDRVLTDRERSLMTEILRQLIRDVEMSVRRALSELLAAEDNAPADLVATLANDDIEVALPILMRGPVLRDIDLIEIIRHRTMRHQLAIAMRETVSETVSDALVETGHVDVIKTLLENRNAEISQATMEYLVEESRRLDQYQNPLVHREDLPPDLAKRMCWWVSAALRVHILENFDIDPADLEDKLEDAVANVSATHDPKDPPGQKSAALASRLSQNREITPRLLVQALRQGEITLFENLLAELTGLGIKLVRRFVFEPGGEGLAISCRAMGVGKGDFASIFLLSRSARPGDQTVDPAELTGVMSFFDRIRPETAQKVLRRWQRDPDFLYALKRVGSGSRNTPAE